MRLLFVIDSFGSGGAQRQMVNLALGLHQRRHQIEFFIYYPQYSHLAKPVNQANIPVHQYHKTRRFDLNPIWKLRQQIIRGNYEGILSFLDTPNLYAEIARLCHSRPFLVVSERFMYLPGRLPRARRVQEQFHRLADHIAVNSHHQRERMEHEFHWMRGKITTIYNGVDLQKFCPPSTPVLRQTSSLNLLAVGSIAAKKNVIGLIQALAIYRERYGNPFCSVSWAGQRVPSEKGEMVYSEAIGLLDRLKLNDCWRWLGERSDIDILLQNHDALVHPSYFEGLPNVVCESLASGRPVLVSDVCDHPKLVQNGVTGLLFDPANPEDIARTIHQFATMKSAERAAMGPQARIFAKKYLSLSRLIDRYENLFCSLL